MYERDFFEVQLELEKSKKIAKKLAKDTENGEEQYKKFLLDRIHNVWVRGITKKAWIAKTKKSMKA